MFVSLGIALSLTRRAREEAGARCLPEKATKASLSRTKYIGDNARNLYKGKSGITIVDDEYDAAKGADALVLVTEWRPYQSPDFELLKETMKLPYIVDGRNIWSTYHLKQMGFDYEGIGVIGK